MHYYCVMDIPNHPLRVKGLEYLQQRERKDDRKEAKMEVGTCPKCGIQLYRPSGTVSLQCTWGYVFSVKVRCVRFELFSLHNCVHNTHRNTSIILVHTEPPQVSHKHTKLQITLRVIHNPLVHLVHKRLNLVHRRLHGVPVE